MEVSSTNQIEVPDTTQSSPVSISSGLNSDPDMADSPAVTGMGHVASVMSSLSQSATVFMSEVAGDPVYSMSPTGDPNTHLLGPDTASGSLVLAVAADGHKFAFPGAVGVGLGDVGSSERLAMLSAASMSEELVLSSTLESGSIKMPETNINFDPDCFLNNPKQGQTYGGNGLKTEISNGNSCSNGSIRCSPPLADNSYGFNPLLIKNIKTEDTSFEQQLAKEGSYQIGEVASNTGGQSGSSGGGSTQSSLALTPTTSLLPSGGGLSPSTTLEQMDFSAIDAKQDYTATIMSATSYAQPIPSPQLGHQSHSPSFFLQSSPQSTQTTSHQNTNMGLSVVKTDSTGTNGHHHHHHHHAQHAVSGCNGSSSADRNGQSSAILLQYQNHFPGAAEEHEEVANLEHQASLEARDGAGQEKKADALLNPGDHLQHCVGNGVDANGAPEHYLQQPEGSGMSAATGTTGTGSNNGSLCNGTEGGRATGSPQQQLQPLLQGAGLVQGLFNHIAAHQGLTASGTNAAGSMELSLDHFDVSFGNQFSDLINDFISVEAGNGATIGAQGGNPLYSHPLMAHSGTEGQVTSGAAPQQVAEEGSAHGAAGYNSADLCLQPCCSPQSAQAGALGTDTGQLAYMQVDDVVSAAVAQGTMGMLQSTGRLFVVTDYSPEWSYPEVSRH